MKFIMTKKVLMTLRTKEAFTSLMQIHLSQVTHTFRYRTKILNITSWLTMTY